MAAKNFAERVAVSENVLDWFKGEAGELEAKGLRVDLFIENLEGAIENAKATNRRQELLKAETKETTASQVRADRMMYRIASAMIDAGGAAYGLDSQKAVQLARLRSKVTRPASGGEKTLPVPRPAQ